MAEGIVEITDKNFDKEVIKSNLPVLVDFWAPWCGPCKMFEPILEQLAAEAGGRFRVGRLNVDDCPVLTANFNILNIPTLMIFKKGDEVDRIVGITSKFNILNKLEKHGC